jgi:hypothetical protein
MRATIDGAHASPASALADAAPSCAPGSIA